jgi:competence protein ComGF
MAKGDYSIRYNPDKLREMIAQGKTAKEITKEFKISPFTLREHLVMLQDLDKKIYVINGLFNYSQQEEARVQKEGIVFTKEMLEKTGFTPGDCFEMSVDNDKIILKKVECTYQEDD